MYLAIQGVFSDMELNLMLWSTWLFSLACKRASFNKMQSNSKREAISKVHLFFMSMRIVRVLKTEASTSIFVPELSNFIRGNLEVNSFSVTY